MVELGKYRVESLIAEGGMAQIYRAKTEGVGGVEKIVALKCLKGALQEDDALVQMLLDEARITVRMTHKNIGQVYGLEHDGDTYFMVMGLVDGVNLAELCKYLFEKKRVFPVEAAVFIAMEACAGLSYAHRMTDDNGEPLGIVHRDVNPQNICISKEGEVKLIDFGIAKAKIATEETQIGTIKGKFNYMSPEQARGERVDQRTDVFALGAVLYEMLTGHMLYPLSLDDARLRTKSRMADFVPIETYLPDLPDNLKKIIAKCLTRDVNQRFATSRDLFLALSKFFHDSCKVYDALNLSMLVEKCINHKKSLKAESAETVPSIRPISSPNQKAQVRLNPEKGSYLDSGVTTVINSDETQTIAEKIVSDDASTILLNRQEVRGDSVGIGINSICRSVDLSIDTKAATAKTLMFKMDDVNASSKSNSNSPKDLLTSIYNKIMTMHERTLILIAFILTTLLVLAIVVFALSGNDNDNIHEEDQDTVENDESLLDEP